MMSGVMSRNEQAAADQIILARERIAPKCKDLLDTLDRLRRLLVEVQLKKDDGRSPFPSAELVQPDFQSGDLRANRVRTVLLSA